MQLGQAKDRRCQHNFLGTQPPAVGKALGKEDEEDKVAIWEFAGRRMQRLQYNPGKAYMASLVLRNSPTAPMGEGAEEAVQLGRFFPLGLI